MAFQLKQQLQKQQQQRNQILTQKFRAHLAKYVKIRTVVMSNAKRLMTARGRGVLPYMTYTGMCRWTGYII